MSHRPTHRPTCGFQAVVRNTCNGMDVRLATQSKHLNTQRVHANNATQAIDSILSCVAFFVCMHCVRCSFLTCIASIALHTAAWKPTFKSVFIGLHALSSCHMQHTQCNGCTACDAIKKPKYTMHAIDSILACVAFFMCMHCITFDSLETDLEVYFLHSGGGGSDSTFGTCRPTYVNGR